MVNQNYCKVNSWNILWISNILFSIFNSKNIMFNLHKMRKRFGRHYSNEAQFFFIQTQQKIFAKLKFVHLIEERNWNSLVHNVLLFCSTLSPWLGVCSLLWLSLVWEWPHQLVTRPSVPLTSPGLQQPAAQTLPSSEIYYVLFYCFSFVCVFRS